MNWLKKYFTTYKYHVRFLMKSGESIYVRCDDIKIERKDDGGLYSYKMEGADKLAAFFIHLGEVAAIQVE